MDTNFTKIDSIEKLEQLFDLSNSNPVILFKHSNACPISRHAYEVMSDFGKDANLVVVQESRDISDEITQKTGIRHESPQVIVLKNGKPIYHSSHYDIEAEDLKSHLN